MEPIEVGISDLNPATPDKGALDGLFSVFEMRVLGIPLWLVGVGIMGYCLFTKSAQPSLSGWDEYEEAS